MDVVVTGRDGKPVHGLQRSDFTLTENDVAQTLQNCEEHSLTAQSPVSQRSPLPPGVFSNQAHTAPDTALTALLFDNLNTPLTDQPRLRMQLVAFLQSLPPPTRIAIFSLNDRIAMLQGFTADPRILAQALARDLPVRSVLLADDQEANSVRQTVQDRLDRAGTPLDPVTVARLQKFENQSRTEQTANRVLRTLNGLDVLARYLAAYPGRKNLVWFSGAFPIDIVVAPRTREVERVLAASGAAQHAGAELDPFAGSNNFEAEFRRTADLLANNQVAVYPVDSRGLISAPEYDSTNSVVSYDPEALTEYHNNLLDEHDSMRRLAQNTGGHAYTNNNDFTRAVQQAMQDGSNYYTLTYTPLTSKLDRSFRHLHVAVNSSDQLALSYRDGYLADPPYSSAVVAAGTPMAGKHRTNGYVDQVPLTRVMEHGVPEPAQVQFTLQVQPAGEQKQPAPPPGNVTGQPGYARAKAPFQIYRVTFHLDARTVLLKPTDQPDTLQALLQFTTLVYPLDGKPVVSTTGQTSLDIRRDQLAALQHQGLSFQQFIAVPAGGTFSLRSGVFDLNSTRVGAIEVPVALVSSLPPIPLPEMRPASQPALKQRP